MTGGCEFVSAMRGTHPSVTLPCIRRRPAVADPDIIAGQQEGTGLGPLLLEVLINADVL